MLRVENLAVNYGMINASVALTSEVKGRLSPDWGQRGR